MKKLIVIALILAAGVSAIAQNLDSGKSRITLVSKQMNVPTEGKFSKFNARIAYDPAKPDAGKAEITIDMASFDIGAQDMNDEAQAKNWFDVKNFPQAKFTATSFKAAGPGRFEVTGPLTIKGKTANVTAPFTVKTDTAGTTYDGSFTIKRLAFNIGEGAWKETDTVADDVQIRFHLVVTDDARPPAAKK